MVLAVLPRDQLNVVIQSVLGLELYYVPCKPSFSSVSFVFFYSRELWIYLRMGLLVYDIILRRFWYDERQGSLFLAQKIKFELVGVVI